MGAAAFLRLLLLMGIIRFCALHSSAQWTPSVNAVKLTDSLMFVAATITNSSVVWHPVNQRYYSLRLGTNTYPLETWSSTGGLSIAQTTCGVDSRGLWYNPNTSQVERNCFSALGWATMGIDGAFNATNAFTMLFTGMRQPNVQAAGAYDPVTNRVVFYDAGNAYFYDRTTATLVQTLPLTGTALTNVTNYTIAWTGQLGYELLLIDRVAKRVLLFNKNTGVFSGASQLPAAATTSTQFNFSYTNNRLWLFTSSLRKWNAYCIWNEAGCPSQVLPVELVDFRGDCANDGIQLHWVTGSETNSGHFDIQRSLDLGEWSTIGRVEAAGHSVQPVAYAHLDTDAGGHPQVYYRLRQVEQDERTELLQVISVTDCGASEDGLSVYPNPASDGLTIRSLANDRLGDTRLLCLLDACGRKLISTVIAAEGPWERHLDVGALPAGPYVLELRDKTGACTARERVVKD